MVTKYTLRQTVAPTTEPVSLAEARDHCELLTTDTTHDTKLTRWIAAARELVELESKYALITQTFTLSFTAFEHFIPIPIEPVQSVSGITYFDGDNTQQTVTSTIYGLDIQRRKVFLEYNQNWPTTTSRHNGIVITFLAGFGTATNVPYTIKQTMLLKIGEWFDDRGDKQRMSRESAYDRMSKKLLRSSYP